MAEVVDLESKIYVPERNRLIVDTWLQYVRDKRTVVFCAFVKHAEQISAFFQETDIRAVSVSGGMKQSERKEFQDKFVSREIQVLCACDLLNEGWNCPETEVLFMTRPTMSKVLYTQQLGRGMRLFEGKESLNCSLKTCFLGLARLIGGWPMRAIIAPAKKRICHNFLTGRNG